jgi:predicted nuclease of restriction endonuclease-like (RecB) superfamily
MELQQQFSEITNLISSAKSRAYQAVNKELLTLYWHVGEYVSKQVALNTWGKSVVQELAAYIQKSEPNSKGFSAQNIWRMKQFYETYSENEKLSLLVRELTWTNNWEEILNTLETENK